jgi:hypothetical protein
MTLLVKTGTVTGNAGKTVPEGHDHQGRNGAGTV